MVTLEHSFLIDFTNMGVRGARETPIRLIVPVYTRAGARARESYQWRKSGMPTLERQDRPVWLTVKNIFPNHLTS